MISKIYKLRSQFQVQMLFENLQILSKIKKIRKRLSMLYSIGLI